MNNKYTIACAVAGSLFAGSALADYNLKITEMWPGNAVNPDLTADWFEITNYGDMAWTAAVDGDLYYDDESQDPNTADLISGIASIAPGESVIAIDDDSDAEFRTVWGAVFDLTSVQIGTFSGAGLGGSGDAVTLWIGDPLSTAPVDVQAYPDTDGSNDASYDVILGAFSTVGNAAGALATIATSGDGTPAIGSPGVAPVPLPAAVWLMLPALGGLLRLRRA